MPEGDTVWRTARTLHARWPGSRWSALTSACPAWQPSIFPAARSLNVTPRGKHLLTRVEGGLTLHSHLGHGGRLAPVRNPPPPAPGLREQRKPRVTPTGPPLLGGSGPPTRSASS